jgi:ech hydrogenase subunit C
MSLIKKIVTWARIKSPWILHFNTGACNACDIELIAALTPVYDVERFGILLKGTP